jgi:hypothetical protein
MRSRFSAPSPTLLARRGLVVLAVLLSQTKGETKLTISNNYALLKRYARSPSAEADFWKGVALPSTPASPIWGLDLNPMRQPLSIDAFIYLVDTSNLWHWSAAVAPAMLSSPFPKGGAGRGGEACPREEAARCIATASSNSDPDNLLAAFAAGVTAIATSLAYAAIREQHEHLAGNHHWILLLYRLANGEFVAGLAHVDEPNPGMLDRGTLLESLKSVVGMDLGSERAIVNQAVRQGGGVNLAPGLRHLVVACPEERKQPRI